MADHYFSDADPAEGRRHQISTQFWDRTWELVTADGVFSRDGLDHATRVLLNACQAPTGGTFLDLGCGWGPLACAVAATSPDVDVWAVDSNPRALDLTRENALRLGGAVRAVLPDGVPDDVTFDTLWSNPPVRIGKQALHELLLTWLARLSPGGHARLVVGKNLGADSLQRWLVDQGHPTTRVTSHRGFRVLHVDGPPPR